MSDISGSVILYIRDNGGTIEYSKSLPTWQPIIWPATIINSTPPTYLQVIFTTPLTFTSPDQYFICGSEYIQFGKTSLNADGTRATITIKNTGYYGLIQNGRVDGIIGRISGKNNITICNISVLSLYSFLGGYQLSNISEPGWLGQGAFSNGAMNNWIINCFSNGDIPQLLRAGGILGEYTGDGGNVTVIGCNTIGQISYSSIIPGGIVGPRSGINSGSITFDQCAATNVYGAGIAGGDSKNITITNCYSIVYTAGFPGFATSGICGNRSNNINVSNCHVSGPSTTLQVAGIIGSGSTNTTSTNCYTTIAVGSNYRGGIYSDVDDTNSALNCYTSGSTDNGTGGIYGNSDKDNLYGSNNFSEANNGNSGTWSDTKASSTLIGVPTGSNPIGTNWVSLGSNQPYNLRNMGHTPYSIDNIIYASGVYSLNKVFNQTIYKGESTIPSILPPGYQFSIVGINNSQPAVFHTITIDASTGQISTTPETALGTYEIIVRTEQDNIYSITTFNLTVEDAPPPEPATNQITNIPPCCQANECNTNPQASNYSQEIISNKRSGKTLNTSVAELYAVVATQRQTVQSKPIFKSYRDYMNYLQGKLR